LWERDEECDYRYITDCSVRNWVYHPYFVLYNYLDQGIRSPTLKTLLCPWAWHSHKKRTVGVRLTWRLSAGGGGAHFPASAPERRKP